MKIIPTILLIFIITFINPPAFAQNRVLSLDGHGDYVEIEDGEALNSINSQVTMEVWIKATKFPNYYMPIIYKGDKPKSGRSYCLWLTHDGQLLVISASSSSNTNIGSSSPIGLITLNTWYHVAGVINGKNSVMNIFINGTEITSGVFGKDIRVSSLPFLIGWTHENYLGYSPFAGQIDEVRIWNIARTPEEIQSTMHTSLSGKEPGLVGYWRFDNIGNIATDSSPNRSDGQLIDDAHITEAELPKPGELVIPTVLSVMITNEMGQPVPGVSFRLEQNGEEITRLLTENTSGAYRIVIFQPVVGLYDLSAISGTLGAWRFGIRLSESEHRKLNLTLRRAINIEGTLLMLDDTTPHVAVPVQAIRDEKVIATTSSDEGGKYRFINLKPGKYQVRCQVLGGYVYYQNVDYALRFTFYDSEVEAEDAGKILFVEPGITLKNINFRFAPFKKGTYRNYTSLDGLASNRVYAIHGTPDGFLWFGTNEGVSRYDGKEFVNFTTRDGLAGNDVAAISSEFDGSIWFGTGKRMPFVVPFDVVGLSRGVYPETKRRGERSSPRRDGLKFVNITTKDGLASDIVYDIYCAGDDVVWFGTSDGVSRYDGKSFVNFTTADGLVSNTVWSIQRDPDGMMWFGTIGGVSRYDGETFTNFTTEDGLAHNEVNAIHCDSDGMVWFATEDGVSRYDGESFLNFTTEDGLADNRIVTIHRSPDGMLWFGTYRGGVSRYDGKKFVSFTEKDGLAGNQVNAIHCDSDGVLWLATDYYISRYDGKGFVNFTGEDGLPHSYVSAIHCDPDDILWFGLGEGEISRYDGKEFVNFRMESGMGADVIAIHREPDGIMWFGTEDGLVRYDGREFVNFTTKDGLAHKCVNDIYRDADGVLWFATGGGVSLYDGEKFENFASEGELMDNWVTAIHSSPDGMMWFATKSGVLCYDGTAWTSLDTRDGLAGKQVSSIHQAEDGSLWFGTDKGITRYRRSVSKPKVRIVSLRTDKDYMKETYKGLSQQLISPITTGSRITIGYSAIDLKTLPEKRQYRTRITKYELRSTNQFEKERHSYNPPAKATTFDWTPKKSGTYVFEVQAIDRDLNYSEPASLTLKVMPPFYLRAGFLVPTVCFGVILIAVLTIVSIGYIKRHRQVQAYQRLAVQELQEAREMQMSLMPESAPPVEGIEIAGKCLSANTVGGDFFDYLEGKLPNEIGIVIADVSGKGLKGAMNAVMTDGILHSVAKGVGIVQPQGLPLPATLSPAHLMSEINDTLKVKMEQYMNVTMVIAAINRNRCERSEAIPKNHVLERSEGSVSETEITLTLANAAHHAYPLILHNGEIQTLKSGGFPLGMRAGVQYSEEQFPLQSGDVLILMTDGIIEAKDSNEQQYSDSGRLEETISQFTTEMSAEAIVAAIINDAIDFGGDRESRDDDMTVVVAKIQ